MISPLLDGLLDPRHVLLDVGGKTAGEAVWEIVELLRESGELSKTNEFFDAVMEREEKASTVANGGVAFPHARTDLVEELRARDRPEPCREFRSARRATPVHLIFLIAVPQQMVNDYLICVGGLARRLNKEATRQALLAASTPAEFFERLRTDE